MRKLKVFVTLALLTTVGAWWYLRRDRVMLELADLPAELPVAEPAAPIQNMDLSEDLALEVDVMLFHFAQALKSRDYDRAQSFLSPAFRGSDPTAGPQSDVSLQSIGVQGTTRTEFQGPPLDAEAFLAALATLFADWSRVGTMEFVVDRADFQVGRPTWGRVRLTGEWVGQGSDEAALSVQLRGYAQVVQVRKRWLLHALELISWSQESRERPIFTEITSAANLHHPGQSIEAGHRNWNGLASADIDGDGLWDFFVPNPAGNLLYVAQPKGGWSDEAERAGVKLPGGGTGVAFFDFDNDGDPDLLVADEARIRKNGRRVGNPLRLYRNDRRGESWSFTEVSEEMGIAQVRWTHGVTIFDFDNDGYLDFFLSNYGLLQHEMPNHWARADNADTNQLFRNLGGKGFEEVSAVAGVVDSRWSFLAAAADYDRDGDQDLYLVNDFGPNSLLRNNGDGTFSDISDDTLEDLGFGMSASWADLNNDGLLDLYVSNMWSPEAHRILARFSADGEDVRRMRKMAAGNTVILARTEGGFEAMPPEYGAVDGYWAWASIPFDVDLDGRLDLFCTNGFITRTKPGDFLTYFWRNVIASSLGEGVEPSIPVRRKVWDDLAVQQLRDFVWQDGNSFSGRERDKLWLNLGSEGFRDVSAISGVDSEVDGRAVVAADLDFDGDPDLLVHTAQGQRHYLYRNDLQQPGRRFLRIRLRATRGQYEALGTEVIVHGPRGPHSQVLGCGAQYLSCQPPELLFGLGDQPEARVEVLWPGGRREEFGPIAAGSSVLLVEGSGAPRAFVPPEWPLTPNSGQRLATAGH